MRTLPDTTLSDQLVAVTLTSGSVFTALGSALPCCKRRERAPTILQLPASASPFHQHHPHSLTPPPSWCSHHVAVPSAISPFHARRELPLYPNVCAVFGTVQHFLLCSISKFLTALFIARAGRPSVMQMRWICLSLCGLTNLLMFGSFPLQS